MKPILPARLLEHLARHLPVILMALSALSLVAATITAASSGAAPSAAQRTEWLFAMASAVLAGAAVAWHVQAAWRFRRRLRLLLDELLGGDYDVDLRHTPGAFADVTVRINEFLGHLREYDSLRAERVARANRALNTVFHAFPQPAALIDAESGSVRVNRAFGRLYNTSARVFTFEALQAFTQNEPFLAMCLSLMPAGSGHDSGIFEIILPPGKQPPRTFNMTSYPFREPSPGGPDAFLVAVPVDPDASDGRP